MKNEKTSKKVQRIAAKGIKKPESLTPEEVKAVCASALTQSPSANEEKASDEEVAVKAFRMAFRGDYVNSEFAFEQLSRKAREQARQAGKYLFEI